MSVEWERIADNPIYFMRRWLRLGLSPEQITFYKELKTRKGRFGLVWPDSDRLAITIASVALWRALCHKKGSILVTPTMRDAQLWHDTFSVFLTFSDPEVSRLIKPISTDDYLGFWADKDIPLLLSLVTNVEKVFDDLGDFDVYLGNFDRTPAEVIDQVCGLCQNKDNLLILPAPKTQ